MKIAATIVCTLCLAIGCFDIYLSLPFILSAIVLCLILAWKKIAIEKEMQLMIAFSCLLVFVEFVICSQSLNKYNSLLVVIKTAYISNVVVMFALFRDKISKALFINIISWTGTVLSLFTIGYYWLIQLDILRHGFNDFSQFRHLFRPFQFLSNTWNSILICFLPFTAYLFRHRKENNFLSVLSYICPLTFNTVAIFLSFSRGAILATIVFFVIKISLSLFSTQPLIRRKVRYDLIVLIFAFSFVLLFYTNEAATTFSLTESISHERSATGRIDVWTRAFYLIKIQPWWGVGSGNFAMAYNLAPSTPLDTFISHPNNIFLQLFVEKGIFGSIVYIIGFALILYNALRKGLFENADIRFSTLCLTGLIALIIRDMFYSSIFHFDAVFTFAIILSVFSMQSVKENAS
jgi:O-antigen ligase